MTRILGGALALLILLLPALVGAQNATRQGTITANGGTVVLQSLFTGAGSVQISGTWTGSVTPIECTLDGTTYAAVPVTPIAGGATVVTTTGNGIWTFSGAFAVCRARATAAWTGTATVNLLVTTARTGGGSGVSNPVTPTQGGLGVDFSASTGVLYDAAGTFSAIACTSGLLQGGAPPTCTATPTVTSLQGIIGNVTPAAGTFTSVALSTAMTLTPTTVGGTGVRFKGAGSLSYSLFAAADDGAGNWTGLQIYAEDGGGGHNIFSANAGSGTARALTIGTQNATSMNLRTNSVNRMTIDSTGAIAAPISLTLGSSSPTAITNVRVYAASLTPSQLAAAVGATEETFTVTGLTTADKVFVNGPAPTALCPPVGYRVSAADTLAITFVDLTIALCTPAAGTYNVVAVRS